MTERPAPYGKHTYNRECPVCKGMCKFVQVNSLVPFEEIQAEIERRKRLAAVPVPDFVSAKVEKK